MRCSVCMGPMEAQRSTKKTCSDKCRWEAYLMKKRGLTLEQWCEAFNYYIAHPEEWEGMEFPNRLKLIFGSEQQVHQDASGALHVEPALVQ